MDYFSQFLGLFLPGILYGIIRTAWRAWRARGAPVRVATPLSQSKSPVDAFFDHPEPEGAVARLREYLFSPSVNPNNPCWYLFARLAELNPFLTAQYEQIFQQQPSETLLLILAQCGNDGTRAMLERTADQSESLREKISCVAANWQPRFLRPQCCHRPGQSGPPLRSTPHTTWLQSR